MTEKHPFGAEMEKAGPRRFVLCVACQDLGHCRLGMNLEELLPDGRTVTRVKCPAEYEGGPGVAHGGWTASVLDEMFGHLALVQGLFTVTAKLSVEYLKPVPVARDLLGYAWVESREKGRWDVAGELRLAANDVVLARATGLFIERDLKHFRKHEQWLAAQDSDKNAEK